LETKRQAANIVAIEREKDNLKLEAEQHRNQCMESGVLKYHRDCLILEANRQAANIVAMEKEIDTLIIEAEHLRGQCFESAALKDNRDILYWKLNGKQRIYWP
jgi:predicted RNase H-like nuclease